MQPEIEPNAISRYTYENPSIVEIPSRDTTEEGCSCVPEDRPSRYLPPLTGGRYRADVTSDTRGSSPGRMPFRIIGGRGRMVIRRRGRLIIKFILFTGAKGKLNYTPHHILLETISTRDSISSNSCASNNSDVPRGPSNLHRWLITVEAVSRREYCRGVNAACKRIGHRLFFHPTRAAIKPKVI